MEISDRAVAIVGLGALLPEAPSAVAFWQNILDRRYCITQVPSERWRPADYYDPNPAAPDKTYSQIGGWVRGFEFDWKRFKIPPRVAAAMDQSQQWAVTVAAEALTDYGYPDRPLDTERTAVILGTAMGGELHYITNMRVVFPEFARALAGAEGFAQLPPEQQQAILAQWQAAVDAALPPVTEDSMPGELPNIVSGRVANVLNLRGPNFITDAACASSLAAVEAAVELLYQRKVEAVITGGVDRNMGVSTFVKFCKIGALSATGTRPFGAGADGFVMGEGAAAFLLKRLADAERDGDRIYAVIRGVGGASDGRGKGITAPNPVGQQLATRRAWENAGLDPATATLVEAHGTSTPVGDVVEVESLAAVFGGAPRGSIGLGSAKSNIGHLKAAAGAAGLLKAVFALHHKVLPPTLNAATPNPHIAFDATPFYLLHEARPWPANGAPRRAGVSAYGFGGTNFHIVLEEHRPGLFTRPQSSAAAARPMPPMTAAPVRGLLAVGAETPALLKTKVEDLNQRTAAGWLPPPAPPEPATLRQPERLAIDFDGQTGLAAQLQKAHKALAAETPAAWRALQAQGVFRGRGPAPGKVAFLFPGQGSQYLNMGRELIKAAPSVAEVFAEADRVMTPILGRPLSALIFQDSADPAAVAAAERALMQTAVTQPAMLTLDIALYRLLGHYGFRPDFVMGHSLGEYAALVAAGIMPFAEALEAAAARGSEMSRVSVADNGWMAAVMAPAAVIENTLREIDGYVVAANLNSHNQCVIGGASQAVAQAIQVFIAKGYQAVRLPVSHAFHTRIVAPASRPLRQMLDRLHLQPPTLPLVANVTGELYPTTVEAIKDLLEQQIASPVQWVKGLETLYANGVRTFVEVGPKKVLKGLVDDVLGQRPDVVSLFTNHPKTGELASFNQALCGLIAAGYGRPAEPPAADGVPPAPPIAQAAPPAEEVTAMSSPATPSLDTLTHWLAQAMRQAAPAPAAAADRHAVPLGSVVVTGTGLGLPGAEKSVMDPDNALRILRGEQFVDLIPERFRQAMLAKRVTRLVKAEDGSGRFETITDPGEVIKLAGRPGAFNLTEEYGVPEKLVEALDTTSQLAMAAGLDALREAGLPLVQTYRRTSLGTLLPDRWLLPEALRDETGVIFASAFPGGDRLADEFKRYYTWQGRQQLLETLEDLRAYASEPATANELARRIAEVRGALEREPYEFDRRFIFRILAMGHSQFAEYIGARGPNTQVNAACASTTQAIALAEDWIRNGRCRRVIVIGADNVTGDHLMEWVGAGFLATGAAATDDRVAEAALPFDRRRHGTLLGMGACALVVESEDAVRERGMRGLVELLAAETNNSAFHGTRLDVSHISQVVETLIASAERRFGLHRQAMASQTVFMSHETFTPARGGSAAAEVAALRHTFGAAASDIIMANTKGFTGHPMGVGVEDVIAVKILEHGLVPPVPNFKEVDPDLGVLNLSRGGRYPVQYAIHLSAGFGSQIALTLTRRIPGALDRVDQPAIYRRWLAEISGQEGPETEVVRRVLRIRATQPPARPPAPSQWQAGTGPTTRALAPGLAPLVSERPARLQVPAPAPSPSASNSQRAPVIAAGAAGAAGAAAPEAPSQTRLPDPPVAPAPQPASAPAPQPASAPPAPPTSAPAVDVVAEQVLGIVAAKTGYPRDMLDLDLDLEADLGVDTVKQAETFAAIREAFDIPRRDDLRLRDYPTLAKVIGFVRTSRPDLAPVPAAQPASAPPTSAPAVDVVAEQVLGIVAAKTGYPRDMLDLDLDLEADLGVDTVKQAETFAAIREAFDIPRRDDLRLRDYPTLAKVIGFVRTSRPDLAPAPAAQPASASAPQPASAPPSPPANTLAAVDALSPRYSLAEADKMPRRVVVPGLRPALELCQPTGVVLDANSRVVVMGDRGGVARALIGRLEKRGVVVLELDLAAPADVIEATLRGWLAAGPIQGVYWLPALDVEPALEAMDLAAWRANLQVRVKNLYTTMRTLYEAVSGAGAFLVSAVRLGGLHGYDEAGALAPMGGGVVGFTKAFKRERPAVTVKAVDFEAGRKTVEPAELLIAETLSDPGVVEVGYRDGLRFSPTFVERPAVDGAPGLALGRDTVFVITGAAGGITSAITADLAAASGGVFYLLDLVPAPDRADRHIALFRQGRDALKAALIDEARTAGEKVTPVQIDRRLMAVERAEAALRAIEAVEAAGGTVHYFSGDLREAAAVSAAIEAVRQRHGRIDVILHAGGLEISRALPDKDPAQFDLVFDVKADGLFNLLKAAQGMPIGAVVAFSSVAGRFGNSGQTDYSAANDLLCKAVSGLRAWRPATRGVVIDWTAWGGIGMATRGSIPKIMELAGIDLLPPESGVPTIRRELTAGGFRGEIIVGGRLGVLAQEWAPAGGLDSDRLMARLTERRPPLMLLGTPVAARLYGGLEVHTVLDPQRQPFLYDHALEGTPLLPGVMGVEAFAQLATLLAPEYNVAAVEAVAFQAPLKFHRQQPRTLRLEITAHPVGGGPDLLAEAVLRSSLQPARADLPAQEKVHFTARIRLSRTPVSTPNRPALAGAVGREIGRQAIYDLYFHGPAYQVLDRAQVDGAEAVGWLWPTLPPHTDPTPAAELVHPRLVELCFQTAGLWEITHKETMALPLAVEAVRAYPFPAEGAAGRLMARVSARATDAAFDAEVVDEAGRVYVEVLGYRTVQLPGRVTV